MGLYALAKRKNLEISGDRPYSAFARELDHLQPLLGGLRDDRPELRRRTPSHCAAQLDDPAFYVAVGEPGIELLGRISMIAARVFLGAPMLVKPVAS
jgi:hypothetical protein